VKRWRRKPEHGDKWTLCFIIAVDAIRGEKTLAELAKGTGPKWGKTQERWKALASTAKL